MDTGTEPYMSTDEEIIRAFFSIVERDTVYYHAAMAALNRMVDHIRELEADERFTDTQG